MTLLDSTRRFAAVVVAALCLVVTPAGAQGTDPPARAPRVALDYGSVAFVRELQRPHFREHLDGSGGWGAVIGEISSYYGFERTPTAERWVGYQGRREFWQTIRSERTDRPPILVRWILAPGRQLAGFWALPAREAPTPDPE